MLGDLFSLHMGGEFSAKEFGLAVVVIFAIEMVNKNSSLLPNVSLGYDIRNYCDSRALAMQEAYMTSSVIAVQSLCVNRTPPCIQRAVH